MRVVVRFRNGHARPVVRQVIPHLAGAEHSEDPRLDPYPLRPADTSNPRSTLEGFLNSVNRAYALVMEADAALTATPPTMTRQEARAADNAAANLLVHAMHTLDLSQVPEALREDTGTEATLQLKEILDRMVLPAPDIVPDALMVATMRKEANGPVRWRYPDTEIEIMEVM